MCRVESGAAVAPSEDQAAREHGCGAQGSVEEKMVSDFENSNQFLSLFALTPSTPIINLLDTLHDEVLEQRKNEKQVFSSTNSVL